MNKAEPITLFGHLKESMSKVGITVERKEHGYTPLTRILSDLSSSNQTLNIRPDGIFYSQSEVGEQRGYIFPLDGFNSSYPKAHICECSRLKKIRYTLKRRYEWANKSDVYVNVAGSIETVHSLPICPDCLQMIRSDSLRPESTSQFVKIILNGKDNDLFPSYGSPQRVTPEWYRIRREYLIDKAYVCEDCGSSFAPLSDNMFIDVYHINGNSQDNRRSNLVSLCLNCRLKEDETLNSKSLLILLKSIRKKR